MIIGNINAIRGLMEKYGNDAKIVDIMKKESVPTDQLINQQKSIEEFISSMVDQIRDMETTIDKMRQKINFSEDIMTKPEKTLLTGQFRALDQMLNQTKETLNYYKNDKCNEISNEIYAQMREGK